MILEYTITIISCGIVLVGILIIERLLEKEE